ncbi:hypothetical protein [Embleya sp. NBC_00896]|uniref:hypothetical protein n=1 Tax=Embleya sp. NBC_00896 TaxID=2975961 RepID=UPI00386CEB53|nr:hypothetical protein OG928_07520 [Embleya sp. NBC_00896]
MKVTTADPAQAYPAAAFPVLAWPDGLSAAPPLPAGCGGVSVRSRSGSRWVAAAGTPVRNVGVDGHPLWHGWGRMIAVVPPGPHLVEVRSDRAEAARVVTVRAGELASLEYAAPRGWAATGVLGEAPVRDVGSTARPLVVSCAAFAVLAVTVVPLLARSYQGPPRWAWPATSLALSTAGLLLTLVRGRRRDARYRRDVADVAHFVDGAPTESGGYFLGPGPGPVPQPGSGQGGLVLTAALIHDLWLHGHRDVRHPYAWIGAPRLVIDGVPHVASWSTWWYPLEVGDHEIEFGLPRSAVPTVAPIAEERVDPPVRLTIRVHTGANHTLAVQAKTRADASDGVAGLAQESAM